METGSWDTHKIAYLRIVTPKRPRWFVSQITTATDWVTSIALRVWIILVILNKAENINKKTNMQQVKMSMLLLHGWVKTISKCYKTIQQWPVNSDSVFLAFDFCWFCVIIRFFHPQWPPTSKDSYTRLFPLHFLSYLYSSERANISLFKVECQTRVLLVAFL